MSEKKLDRECWQEFQSIQDSAQKTFDQLSALKRSIIRSTRKDCGIDVECEKSIAPLSQLQRIFNQAPQAWC
jgi:hypothetical protein